MAVFAPGKDFAIFFSEIWGRFWDLNFARNLGHSWTTLSGAVMSFDFSRRFLWFLNVSVGFQAVSVEILPTFGAMHDVRRAW